MKLLDLKIGDCLVHKLPGFYYMFEVERVFDIDGPCVTCKHFISISCSDNRFELDYRERSIYFLSNDEDSNLSYIDKNEFYKYVALSRTTKTAFKNLIV